MARILADLDVEELWTEANERERRILVENLVEWIKVFPDHLEVKVVGSPQINVTLGEVGLKVPENVGVGGPTRTRTRTNLETPSEGCGLLGPDRPHISATARDETDNGYFSMQMTFSLAVAFAFTVNL